MERLTIITKPDGSADIRFLDKEFEARFKEAAARAGIPLEEAVAQAIERWMKARKP